ncbi:MAG: VWA domain-containing protein [Planctomycetota bacterium]|nr:MAG: VWA domain-containing protein [Planctomycetota bacterium]
MRLKSLLCIFCSIFITFSLFAASKRERETRISKEIRSEAVKNSAAAVAKIIPYLGDSSPYIRETAYKNILLNIRDEGAIRLLAKELTTNSNPMVREQIAELLGNIASAETAGKSLLRALKDTSQDVRLEAVRALGKLEYKPAVKLLGKYAQKSRFWLLQVEAFSAYAKIRGIQKSDKVLKKVLKSRHPRVQAAALQILLKYSPLQALEEALVQLKKLKPKKIQLRYWPVYYACLKILEKNAKNPKAPISKLRAVIDKIISIVRKLDGRMKYATFETLAKATGKSLNPDYRAWKYWWDMNKSRFVPEGNSGSITRPSTAVRYHGVSIYSKRIIFIVDKSGSMRYPVKGEGEYKNRIKMDVCKEALIKTIRSLSKDTYFNIIFFGTKLRPWKKQLQKATRANKASAIKFVSSMQIRGRTNIYDSLFQALNDPFADTIFLLSDGGPSEGKYIFTRRVEEKVRQINRFANFEIHTIIIGSSKSRDRRFMENLARENGGEFHHKGGERKRSSHSSKRRRRGKRS